MTCERLSRASARPPAGSSTGGSRSTRTRRAARAAPPTERRNGSIPVGGREGGGRGAWGGGRTGGGGGLGGGDGRFRDGPGERPGRSRRHRRAARGSGAADRGLESRRPSRRLRRGDADTASRLVSSGAR